MWCALGVTLYMYSKRCSCTLPHAAGNSTFNLAQGGTCGRSFCPTSPCPNTTEFISLICNLSIFLPGALWASGTCLKSQDHSFNCPLAYSSLLQSRLANKYIRAVVSTIVSVGVRMRCNTLPMWSLCKSITTLNKNNANDTSPYNLRLKSSADCALLGTSSAFTFAGNKQQLLLTFWTESHHKSGKISPTMSVCLCYKVPDDLGSLILCRCIKKWARHHKSWQWMTWSPVALRCILKVWMNVWPAVISCTSPNCFWTRFKRICTS